jgi:hypothetical protein
MVKCIFDGSPDGYIGWKLWDPFGKKAIMCKSVVYDEQLFPMSRLAQSTPSFAPPSAPPDSLQAAQDHSQVPDAGGDEGTFVPLACVRVPGGIPFFCHPFSVIHDIF